MAGEGWGGERNDDEISQLKNCQLFDCGYHRAFHYPAPIGLWYF